MANMDKAVFKFIKTYTNLLPTAIIKGWQGVSLLPPNSEEYAVFTCLSSGRRGTNIEDYNHLNNELNIMKTAPASYQIDVVSMGDNARMQINRLETLARSAAGVEFFKTFNISLLYADEPRAVELIGTAGKFLNRFIMTLYLEDLTKVTLPQDFTGKAVLSKIKKI